MIDFQPLRLGLMALTLMGYTATAMAAQDATTQDLASATEALPEIMIYPAREVLTLDPKKPTAQAVAVVGDRIFATGSLDRLKALIGKQPYTVNKVFSDHVIVPGFIAQHDHPLLAALTMTSEIIAIEDWVLPHGTSKAAKIGMNTLTGSARRTRTS